MQPYLLRLKTSENRKVFQCFHGYGALGKNGLTEQLNKKENVNKLIKLRLK